MSQINDFKIIINTNQILQIIQSLQHSINTDQFNQQYTEEAQILTECLKDIISGDDTESLNDLSLGSLI
jgi:hypothetical protein